MPVGIRLLIDSNLDQVALVSRAVRAVCEDLLGAEASDAVELSVVEAVNNVIKHGYAGRSGEDVEVTLALHQGEVVVEVADQAMPMQEDLLRNASGERFAFDETDRTAIPESGMGLSLIRMNMDEVDYRSEDGRNYLRMVKRIGRHKA